MKKGILLKNLLHQHELKPYLILSLIGTMGWIGAEIFVAFLLNLFLSLLGFQNPQALSLPKLQTFFQSFGPNQMASLILGFGFLRGLAIFLQEFSAYSGRNRFISNLQKSNSSQNTPSLSDFSTTSLQAGDALYYALTVSGQILAIFLLLGTILFLFPQQFFLFLPFGFLAGLLFFFLHQQIQTNTEKLPKIFSKACEQIKLLQIFQRELTLSNWKLEELQKINQQIDHIHQKRQRICAWECGSHALMPVMGLFILMCLVFLSQKILHTPGTQLLTFLFLMFRFVQMTHNANHLLGQMNQNWSFLVQSSQIQASPPPLTTSLKPQISFPSEIVLHSNLSLQIKSPFNLDLQDHQKILLRGKSGAGKSSLLNWITKQTADQSPFYSLLLLRSQPLLWPEETVSQNLFRFKTNTPHRRKLVKTWFPEFPDQAFFQKPAQDLSEGQKQKIALLRAIFEEPHLLIIDEGLSNLDQKQVLWCLKNLSKEIQTTLFFVSHQNLSPQDFHQTWDLKNNALTVAEEKKQEDSQNYLHPSYQKPSFEFLPNTNNIK